MTGFWQDFLLLGASTALSLILVNAIITLLLFFKDDYLWMNRYSVLVFLLLILATLTGLTWEGFFSSFASLFEIRELYMISTILGKLGSWQKTLFRSREVLLENPSGQDDL
jgi:uncharacterized membrane protein